MPCHGVSSEDANKMCHFLPYTNSFVLGGKFKVITVRIALSAKYKIYFTIKNLHSRLPWEQRIESNIEQKLCKSETGFLPNTVAFSLAHDSSRLEFSWNFLEISRKLWRKISRWQGTVSRRKTLWRKLCSSRWSSDLWYTPNSYYWTNDLRFQQNSKELTIDLSYTDKSTSQSRCSFWRFYYTDDGDRWTRICWNSWELWNPENLHMIWCIDKLFLEKNSGTE